MEHRFIDGQFVSLEETPLPAGADLDGPLGLRTVTPHAPRWRSRMRRAAAEFYGVGIGQVVPEWRLDGVNMDMQHVHRTVWMPKAGSQRSAE